MNIATIGTDIKGDIKGEQTLIHVSDILDVLLTYGLSNQCSPSAPVIRSIFGSCETSRDEPQEHCDKGNTQTDSIRDSNTNLTALLNHSHPNCLFYKLLHFTIRHC